MTLRFSQLRELVIDLPHPTRVGEQRRFIVREDPSAEPLYTRSGAFPKMSDLVEDGVLVAEYHYDETMGRDLLMWTIQRGGEKIVLDMGRGVGYPWA